MCRAKIHYAVGKEHSWRITACLKGPDGNSAKYYVCVFTLIQHSQDISPFFSTLIPASPLFLCLNLSAGCSVSFFISYIIMMQFLLQGERQHFCFFFLKSSNPWCVKTQTLITIDWQKEGKHWQIQICGTHLTTDSGIPMCSQILLQPKFEWVITTRLLLWSKVTRGRIRGSNQGCLRSVSGFSPLPKDVLFFFISMLSHPQCCDEENVVNYSTASMTSHLFLPLHPVLLLSLLLPCPELKGHVYCVVAFFSLLKGFQLSSHQDQDGMRK